jgi:hypothetical protein
MSKKVPVYVNIQRGKNGGYTFSIDKPGPAKGQTKKKDGEVKEYSTGWSAWRGALRQLGAVWTHHVGGGKMAWMADCGGRFGWREVKRVNVQ